MVTSFAAASVLLDARGYRRSIATQPGFQRGRVPRNRGRRYPPDPPTTEEIVELLRGCPDTPSGRRTRALILLWRSGLRISEALGLEERDLDAATGSITVRHGKGGKRRIVGMDPWGWAQLASWLEERLDYPCGPAFCVVRGPRRDTPRRAAPPRPASAQVGRASLVAVECGYYRRSDYEEAIDGRASAGGKRRIRRHLQVHELRIPAVSAVRAVDAAVPGMRGPILLADAQRRGQSRRPLPRRVGRRRGCIIAAATTSSPKISPQPETACSKSRSSWRACSGPRPS